MRDHHRRTPKPRLNNTPANLHGPKEARSVRRRDPEMRLLILLLSTLLAVNSPTANRVAATKQPSRAKELEDLADVESDGNRRVQYAVGSL